MAVFAEIRRNTTLVVVAAGVFLLLQVVLSGFARPLSAEEAAVLPAGAGSVLGLVRLTMMLLSTVAFVVAFRSWVRPAARVAWAAAGVFAVSWGPVYFGPEVRPHLLAALACVAAGGFTSRWLVERERTVLAGIAVSVAAAVALRPLAAVGLVVTLVLVAVVGARRESIAAIAAVAFGAVVGWSLGMLGFVARFSGRVVEVGLGPPEIAGGLQQLLVAMQSPLAPSRSTVTPTYVVVAVLGVLAVGLALAQLRWAHRRNAALIGLTLALGLFVPPVAINRITAAELLPAYAALTIPLGAGVLAAWDATRRIRSTAVTVAFFLLLTAFVVWEITLAVRHGVGSPAG